MGGRPPQGVPLHCAPALSPPWSLFNPLSDQKMATLGMRIDTQKGPKQGYNWPWKISGHLQEKNLLVNAFWSFHGIREFSRKAKAQSYSTLKLRQNKSQCSLLQMEVRLHIGLPQSLFQHTKWIVRLHSNIVSMWNNQQVTFSPWTGPWSEYLQIFNNGEFSPFKLTNDGG